ncbi:hypothetical protein KQI61_05845 [Anaerocolumna aminovalerica]|uniref:hypothetical protein n=1 Tax=Anaerocolumna aminovalerica TaxID=1527 RepID=UPI001C0EF99D|nr:hypothetical protein [Anaerocolumna aminovalerica]MBU5331712.1 hypothetical protein [Anaerocolumna aminovalerica]
MSTPITFDIGFLGYTSELSIKGLKKFAENNIEQVKDKKFNNCNAEVYLYDGTTIKAITYGMNLRGYKFDQLVLFDDNRWNIGIERHQWEIIDEI